MRKRMGQAAAGRVVGIIWTLLVLPAVLSISQHSVNTLRMVMEPHTSLAPGATLGSVTSISDLGVQYAAPSHPRT